jgi:hypothetical protein
LNKTLISINIPEQLFYTPARQFRPAVSRFFIEVNGSKRFDFVAAFIWQCAESNSEFGPIGAELMAVSTGIGINFL